MLSGAKARKLKQNDKPASDGTVSGLYLVPSGTPGSGKWILRFVSPVRGRRREMGLGSYPTTSTRDARAKAFEARGVIDDGKDPLELRREQAQEMKGITNVPTFEDAASRHADMAEGFRNKKHVDHRLGAFMGPRYGLLAMECLQQTLLFLKVPTLGSMLKHCEWSAR